MILRFNLLTNKKNIKYYDYLEKGKKFYEEKMSKYQNHSNMIKVIDDNGIYNISGLYNQDIRVHYPVDWSKLVNISINDLQELNTKIS